MISLLLIMHGRIKQGYLSPHIKQDFPYTSSAIQMQLYSPQSSMNSTTVVNTSKTTWNLILEELSVPKIAEEER